VPEFANDRPVIRFNSGPLLAANWGAHAGRGHPRVATSQAAEELSAAVSDPPATLLISRATDPRAGVRHGRE
jgi:hypothetical protein